MFCFFFFNDTATTEIYTLSLHDALPISRATRRFIVATETDRIGGSVRTDVDGAAHRLLSAGADPLGRSEDRKSTRLNSSHANISYAVFCLKKKKTSRT